MAQELSTLGAVIKTAYEGQPDTNAFTDAEKSKLAGMEENATRNSSDDQLRDRTTHTGGQAASTIIDLPELLDQKVDVVDGFGLSESNFTAEEKSKLAAIEDSHFKGVFVGLAALQSLYPSADAGDYASVDEGVSGVNWYAWDADSSTWVVRVGEGSDVTPAQVKQYYESNPDTNAFTDNEKDQLAALQGRFAWRRLGVWNAATNTPSLINGTGNPGDYYVVTTPGSLSFGNATIHFLQYDWVMFQGGTWNRIPISVQRLLINGKTQDASGAVNLTAADVGALPASYVPAYSELTGAPDLPELYQPKQRGNIGPAIPAAAFYLTANHNLTTNVYEYVPFSGVLYDQFNMRTNASTFTVPAWAKYARVTGNLRFASSATGGRQAGVRRNNVDVIGASYDISSVAVGGSTSRRLETAVIPVVGGDTLRVVAFQSSGGILAIEAGTSQQHTWVQIELYE